MNKALAVSALGDNRAAVGLYDRAIEIRERLVHQEGRWELANDLAMAYMNKAIAVSALGDHRAALALYDRAIESMSAWCTRKGGGSWWVIWLIKGKSGGEALIDLGDVAKGHQRRHARRLRSCGRKSRELGVLTCNRF